MKIANKQEIEQFSYSAINIIIKDIMELDIVVPRLVFDYSTNPNIKSGYYMYQNVSGDIITLNMNAILELRYHNDIKTVITYGFIHEIMHMYQPMTSDYIYNQVFYTLMEDQADYSAIDFIKENMELINKRLNFKFNEVFIHGIERQLMIPINKQVEFDNSTYIIKTICGALCSKLNLNFDTLCESLRNKFALKIIFPDKREYNIDLHYATSNELNILINLIYLTNFGMIYFEEFVYYNFDGSVDCRQGIFKLF